MNRPIKFRVWDKITNRYLQELGIYYWHIPYSLDGEEITGEANLFGLSELLRHNNFVAQQYTGLNDSKGNPIYEGDIVINTTSDEEYCSPAVIVWGKYEFVGFSLAYKCNKLEDYHAPLIHKINGVDLVEEFSLSKMGTYQIVGNASENPELLK